MKILFVNCCMKPDKESRTYRLATAFLDKYQELNNKDVHIFEVALKNEAIRPISNKDLTYRLKLIQEQAWGDRVFRYATKFANADRIVIAAPYWDLSFPSILKIYFENVFVTNLTFYYEGTEVKSLCKAEKLLYVTTSGGYVEGMDFGTDYVRGVAKMFEIGSFDALKAEGLDIDESAAEAILSESIAVAEDLATKW